MQLVEREVPAEQRERMLHKAQAHWLMALGTLEEPRRRPCLILIGGLPGTGKSTLARGLAENTDVEIIRSDVIRKELAGVPVAQKAAGCYTAEWTERTYAECVRRARDAMLDGRRVVVDASFADEGRREQFLELAQRLGVPAGLFICRLDPDSARNRLQARQGDASDAGWEVYEEMAASWERMSESTERLATEIDTTNCKSALQAVTQSLAQMELV